MKRYVLVNLSLFVLFVAAVVTCAWSVSPSGQTWLVAQLSGAVAGVTFNMLRIRATQERLEASIKRELERSVVALGGGK